MSDTLQILNDTGFHPEPGWVLAEHIDQPSTNKIVVPEHLRKNGESEPSSYDEFKIVVLEDGDQNANTKMSGPCKFLAPGTKIMTTGRDGFKHRGRKLLMLQREAIIATID